jgi:hypothetical protein
VHQEEPSQAAANRESVKRFKAESTDTSGIGAVAADALDEIHSAIYGRPPEASRAWTDGDAILLVLRIAPQPDARAGAPPIGEMQRMVCAAVQRRTGVMLRAGGVNIEEGRGLAVLAFERLRATSGDEPAETIPAGPVRGAG